MRFVIFPHAQLTHYTSSTSPLLLFTLQYTSLRNARARLSSSSLLHNHPCLRQPAERNKCVTSSCLHRIVVLGLLFVCVFFLKCSAICYLLPKEIVSCASFKQRTRKKEGSNEKQRTMPNLFSFPNNELSLSALKFTSPLGQSCISLQSPKSKDDRLMGTFYRSSDISFSIDLSNRL